MVKGSRGNEGRNRCVLNVKRTDALNGGYVLKGVGNLGVGCPLMESRSIVLLGEGVWVKRLEECDFSFS
jgi:hypothetical protein